MVGEGIVNITSKSESVTDKENYIDFKLRLLGDPGTKFETFFAFVLFVLFVACSVLVRVRIRILFITETKTYSSEIEKMQPKDSVSD